MYTMGMLHMPMVTLCQISVKDNLTSDVLEKIVFFLFLDRRMASIPNRHILAFCAYKV